ncbi:CDK5 regulatory subunit-associated protein 2-like [Artemia franciscana]|uniref:CDK5 regulatory subunit-associated protein 2-like n=1 Tax=Artemia franciscana TaxID=6661 RepID=UPI0032DA530E
MMEDTESNISSIQLSPLSLTSDDIDGSEASDAGVSQLSESLFKFITPMPKAKKPEKDQKQVKKNLANNFESLSKANQNGITDIQGEHASHDKLPENIKEKITIVASDDSRSTLTSKSVEAVYEGKGAEEVLAPLRQSNSISTQEKHYDSAMNGENTVKSIYQHRLSILEPVIKRSEIEFSNMDKELSELKKFGDSLTEKTHKDTQPEISKRSANSALNNLSSLYCISDHLNLDEEKDKREHYEAQVVKLQSRVLELEEQLALANASTIRKDRTIQETKHKFQCAIKKLEEMSNCSAKEVQSLREEKEYLEKELKKEKEKAQEMELKFKEVLKIAENLREKYQEVDALSRTLNLELTDLRGNNKTLHNDCSILDEENRRLVNSLSDLENKYVKLRLENEKLMKEFTEANNCSRTLKEEVDRLTKNLNELTTKNSQLELELRNILDQKQRLQIEVEDLISEKAELKKSFEAKENLLLEKCQKSEEDNRQRMEEFRKDYGERSSKMRQQLSDEYDVKLHGLVVSFEEQLNQLKQKMIDETNTLKIQNNKDIAKLKSKLEEREAQIAKMKKYNSYLADHCKSMMQFQLTYFNASSGRDQEAVTALPAFFAQGPSMAHHSKKEWPPTFGMKNTFEDFMVNLQKSDVNSNKEVCLPGADDVDNQSESETSGTVISSFNASSVKIFYPHMKDVSKTQLKGLVDEVLNRPPSSALKPKPKEENAVSDCTKVKKLTQQGGEYVRKKK